MKVRSVRLRLLLWNIGLLLVILFGFLIITHISVRTYLLSSIDHRLDGMAKRQQWVLDHRDEVRAQSANRDRERNSERRRDSRPRMIRLFDQQGRPITFTGQPVPKDTPVQTAWDRTALTSATAGTSVFSFVQAEDGTLRVLSRPLISNKEQIGVAQAAVSFEEARVMLDSLTLMLMLFVPCALILAGISGLYLTNKMLHPVRQIVEAAEALHPDDLSQRLPVAGEDEFAHLAITINGMLDHLGNAFASLKESVERERRFTGDASHELRTPLTAIKANARLALKGERTPAQYREALQAIDQASEAMQRLIQDMLLLARTDSGQVPVQPQAIDPFALFREAVGMARHGEHQAPVRIDIAPGIGNLQGDPHQLQRLLMNLLDNALRHTPADGSVTLSVEQRGERIALIVADTGEGIAQEHLPHLGERFYRVDAARARQHGGTGLGLAICRSIVDAHHGTLTIDSTPGEGTRVTVLLPSRPA